MRPCRRGLKSARRGGLLVAVDAPVLSASGKRKRTQRACSFAGGLVAAMPRPRFTLRSLMIAVAVVGLLRVRLMLPQAEPLRDPGPVPQGGRHGVRAANPHHIGGSSGLRTDCPASRQGGRCEALPVPPRTVLQVPAPRRTPLALGRARPPAARGGRGRPPGSLIGWTVEEGRDRGEATTISDDPSRPLDPVAAGGRRSLETTRPEPIPDAALLPGGPPCSRP